MNVEQVINNLLISFNVVVRFGQRALEDFSDYNKDFQEKIVALIIKRGQTGPLIIPDGIGKPLKGELQGFTKIKPKNLKIRIIYRPLKNGNILMEIIAIGPRDRKMVYKIATDRVASFKREMSR